jgi:hypothetical protein
MARTMRVKGQRGEDDGMRESFECSQYGRGRSLIMATATVPPQASDRVYGVEEMVAKLDAEVGV